VEAASAAAVKAPMAAAAAKGQGFGRRGKQPGADERKSEE
jgi:hypothetical protein